MGIFKWHILSPVETFAKVEAMSDSRSIEDLPIIICCSFGWIPVFFDRFILGTAIAQALLKRSDFSCVATFLVNMSDIEPRKEDDGFDGAFLSP